MRAKPWGRLERVADGVWTLISTPLAGDEASGAMRTFSNGGIVAGREGCGGYAAAAPTRGSWAPRSLASCSGEGVRKRCCRARSSTQVIPPSWIWAGAACGSRLARGTPPAISRSRSWTRGSSGVATSSDGMSPLCGRHPEPADGPRPEAPGRARVPLGAGARIGGTCGRGARVPHAAGGGRGRRPGGGPPRGAGGGRRRPVAAAGRARRVGAVLPDYYAVAFQAWERELRT